MDRIPYSDVAHLDFEAAVTFDNDSECWIRRAVDPCNSQWVYFTFDAAARAARENAE